MSKLAYFQSTLGRKQIVGLAGLGLAGFVLSHMAGNLLLLVSPQAYNEYAHALVSNPLLYVAELGLVGLFLGHIVMAVILTLKNKSARPNRYHVVADGKKKTSLAQKTLIHQGMIILIFLILHLITFKFGPGYSGEADYTVAYGGVEMRDMYKLVAAIFQNPAWVGFYVFTLLLLGFHLNHGLQSSIKTLGFNHPKYEPKIKLIGSAYAWIVTLGFISQPVVLMLKGN